MEIINFKEDWKHAPPPLKYFIKVLFISALPWLIILMLFSFKII